jgi:hypothetical protein
MMFTQADIDSVTGRSFWSHLRQMTEQDRRDFHDFLNKIMELPHNSIDNTKKGVYNNMSVDNSSYKESPMQSREVTGLEKAEMVYGMDEQTYLDIADNAGYAGYPEEQPGQIGDDMNDSGEID